MKSLIIRLMVLTFLMFAPILSTIVKADDPGDPGAGGDGTELGAPLGEGIALLIIGAIGYGSKKVYDSNKKKEN